MHMHPERLVFVGRALDHVATKAGGRSPDLKLVFPGIEMALRDTLEKATHFLRGLGFERETCGLIELVLAEALNNVVEHAFSGMADGIVELQISKREEVLHFLILDDGLPMPGDAAPAGLPQDLTCAVEDMPEGGFGWFLIRELTEDLSYTRSGNRNRLQFTMRPNALPQ